jgi:hypothetical protein
MKSLQSKKKESLRRTSRSHMVKQPVFIQLSRRRMIRSSRTISKIRISISKMQMAKMIRIIRIRTRMRWIKKRVRKKR